MSKPTLGIISSLEMMTAINRVHFYSLTEINKKEGKYALTVVFARRHYSADFEDMLKENKTVVVNMIVDTVFDNQITYIIGV